MNWAEQQLARAQQSQRPLSDLPGFAANFLKNQQQTEGGVGGEEEYEEHALFNPGLVDQVVCSRAILPSQHSASAVACAACACNCTWYNVVGILPRTDVLATAVCIKQPVRKRRLLKTAADLGLSAIPEGSSEVQSVGSPRSEEMVMDDVLSVLFEDENQVLVSVLKATQACRARFISHTRRH